jgi:hypothetical protein
MGDRYHLGVSVFLSFCTSLGSYLKQEKMMISARFIISVSVILISVAQLSASDFRIIKGIVTDDQNDVLIGATIEEYGNRANQTLSDLNGHFEISIPKKDKVILRVTYGCSASEVLVEVLPQDDFVRIVAFDKQSFRNTKAIRRKWKRTQKKNDTGHLSTMLIIENTGFVNHLNTTETTIQWTPS